MTDFFIYLMINPWFTITNAEKKFPFWFSFSVLLPKISFSVGSLLRKDFIAHIVHLNIKSLLMKPEISLLQPEISFPVGRKPRQWAGVKAFDSKQSDYSGSSI